MPCFSTPSTSGGDSYELIPASHYDSTTVNSEDGMNQERTCDAPCCSHGCGCTCKHCFCQGRPDTVDANRNRYGGQGGYGDPGFQNGLTLDGGVDVLGARLASLHTDEDRGSFAPRPDFLVAPPSFEALQQAYAHEHPDEQFNMRIRRYIESPTPSSTYEDDDPCHDPMLFEMDLSIDSSDIIPHEDLSQMRSAQRCGHSHSSAVRDVGALFEEAPRTSDESHLPLEPASTFLKLVPECRHSTGCIICARMLWGRTTLPPWTEKG